LTPPINGEWYRQRQVNACESNEQKGKIMAGKGKDSVYKVVLLVGTSTKSWEEAAKNAVETAGTLRDLRVAEVSELDMVLKDGKVESYRAKVKVSFKYEGN
jgi:flavin-binding protein dodecin